MKTLFLPLAFVFYLLDDDKNLTQQLVQSIKKQDKRKIENLLKQTDIALMQQALNASIDMEKLNTPKTYAQACYEVALNNSFNRYNNDRIHDTILASLKCLTGVGTIIYFDQNSITTWGAGTICALWGLINFKDAYYNTSATHRAKQAFNIMQKLSRYPFS